MAEKFDGITPPDNVKKGKVNLSPQAEKHVVDFAKKYNLGEDQAIVGSIDYYQEQYYKWKAHAQKIEAQAKEEIGQLRDMVQKIGEENLRLKKLLKEHGVG